MSALCPTCRRLPLHEQPEAAEALLSAIRMQARDRLQRAESVLLGCNEEARLGIADWLGAMLRRPPLSRPSPAFAPMAALIDALWWDIHDVTPDPLDGESMHPRLAENHPWAAREDDAA